MRTSTLTRNSLINFFAELENAGFAVKVFDFGNNNLQEFYGEQTEDKIASLWTIVDQKIEDQNEFKIYLTTPLSCKLTWSHLKEMIENIANFFDLNVIENFDYFLLKAL